MKSMKSMKSDLIFCTIHQGILIDGNCFRSNVGGWNVSDDYTGYVNTSVPLKNWTAVFEMH